VFKRSFYEMMVMAEVVRFSLVLNNCSHSKKLPVWLWPHGSLLSLNYCYFYSASYSLLVLTGYLLAVLAMQGETLTL
jgi:hypothetical protein